MYCSKCGAQNQKADRYCGKCGEPIGVHKQEGKSFGVIVTICSLIALLTFAGLGTFLYIDGQKKQAEPIKAAVQPIKKEVAERPAEKKETPELTKDKKTIIQESQGKVYTIFTEEAQGSGFLFDQQGHVATNAHVVAGYTDVTVRTSQGENLSGKVIGLSDQVDIALIQVDALAGQAALPIENTETAVGTEVIALGSPRGLENTASIGYLTGAHREFDAEYHYKNAYQLDAQVSPGSSGGPLLDAQSGKVIGINSAVLTADQTIAFSIPLYTVSSQLEAWAANPMSPEELYGSFYYYEEHPDYWQDGGMYEEEDYGEDYDWQEPYDSYPYEEENVEMDDDSEVDALEAYVLDFLDNFDLANRDRNSSYVDSYYSMDSEAAPFFDAFFQRVMDEQYSFINRYISDIVYYGDEAEVTLEESYSFTDAFGTEEYFDEQWVITIQTVQNEEFTIKKIETQSN